ncbi:hypothetical protein I2I11_19885 [Pontibacter sp. 172403-2]|uniref:hypothetical protein n=1 Tax=Pontibacter rufus TaxID=2791028 RepID=UPI0018AF5AFB|nr:hypothetical protein [Pontibacter sp. 172403-2]MBF9255570.1 hypothetical protein [Pontibacter sp. 172403-2]
MKKYTLKLNLLIPILRIAFLGVSIGMIILMIFLIRDKEWGNFSEDAVFVFYTIFVIWAFSLGGYQMVKGVLTETLWIKITEEHIEIRNLTKFRKHILTKSDISSIFRSNKQFGRGTWKTVVIYTREGKSYELVQFNYFDFKKIIEAFIHFGYRKPIGKTLEPNGLEIQDEFNLE